MESDSTCLNSSYSPSWCCRFQSFHSLCTSSRPFSTGDPWTGVPTDPPTDPPTKVNTICPQENVQHWDKIIFEPKLKGSENEISIPGVPGSELREKKQHDIKILDDPNTVVDLERAVAQKLNSLGYFVEKQLGGDSTTIQEVSPNNIKIKDVEYAIACVSNAVDPEPPSEI